MKRFLLIAAFFILTLSCSGTQDIFRIEGKWKMVSSSVNTFAAHISNQIDDGDTWEFMTEQSVSIISEGATNDGHWSMDTASKVMTVTLSGSTDFEYSFTDEDTLTLKSSSISYTFVRD